MPSVIGRRFLLFLGETQNDIENSAWNGNQKSTINKKLFRKSDKKY